MLQLVFVIINTPLFNLVPRVSLLPAKRDCVWREEERPWEQGWPLLGSIFDQLSLLLPKVLFGSQLLKCK